MANHDIIPSRHHHRATILGHIYPDRPAPVNYAKYKDVLLTDATIDAGDRHDDYLYQKTHGRSLFVDLWSPLSRRFLEEWKDIRYDINAMFQTYKKHRLNTGATHSQDSGVPYDTDDILEKTRTFKIVLVSDAEEAIMNDPTRLWQLFDCTYEGKDFQTKTVFKIPTFFDVILGLRLPWSHPSDKVTLSIYIASYHAFDVEVNKNEPVLMVDGRYPLLFPRYHNVVIVGMKKDEFLILFGSIFCDDSNVRSCLCEQRLVYHLNDQHQLSEIGGMAFKIAAQTYIESQLITDRIN